MTYQKIDILLTRQKYIHAKRTEILHDKLESHCFKEDKDFNLYKIMLLGLTSHINCWRKAKFFRGGTEV